MPLSIAFLFLAWVSSAERYWVTLAKRRRAGSIQFIQLTEAQPAINDEIERYPGLRPEDMFALRPADVHDGAVWINEGKTEASEASVHVPGDLGVALRAWMETCQGPWLFTGARGSTIDRHNYLSRVLKPAAKRERRWRELPGSAQNLRYAIRRSGARSEADAGPIAACRSPGHVKALPAGNSGER